MPTAKRITTGSVSTPDSQPTEDEASTKQDVLPKLLVWSAADKGGIGRIAKSYQDWYDADESLPNAKGSTLVEDLAYTLDQHRSRLAWRSFALVRSSDDLHELQSRMTLPVRVRSEPPRLGFVFSGQGAQWFAMGRELLSYPSFRMELVHAGLFLESLGCRWSVIGK